MKYTMFFLQILFTLLILIGCQCASCTKDNSNPNIPDSIFVKGDLYIQSKTGKTFFDNYIFRNYSESQNLDDYFELHYALSDPEKDFVHGKILFYVDTTGNHLERYEDVGIPNCLGVPLSCEFNLTKEEAIEIAKRENLKEGIRPWDVSFRWDADVDMYVWHILVTLREIKSEQMFKANGEEMMIAPANGEVLKYREWNIF